MSPREIVAFADGADQLLAGKRAFRQAAFSLFKAWKGAQTFAQGAIGATWNRSCELSTSVAPARSAGARATRYARGKRRLRDLDHAPREGLQRKRVTVANGFRFQIVDGRLSLDEDEMRLLYVAVTRAQHVLGASELREELLRLFNLRR
jgi:hypothetical protein